MASISNLKQAAGVILDSPLYNISDLTWDGRGVSRTAVGQVAFITGAIPGDKVTAVFGYSRMRGAKPGRVSEVIFPSLFKECVKGIKNHFYPSWRMENMFLPERTKRS